MKESAGTLLYRRREGTLEVLLVHPSGNYNRKAPWGIPKGLAEEGETLEAAARRETLEEAGVIAGDLVSLSSIDYRKSRKRVHCFAWRGPGRRCSHLCLVGNRPGGIPAARRSPPPHPSRSGPFSRSAPDPVKRTPRLRVGATAGPKRNQRPHSNPNAWPLSKLRRITLFDQRGGVDDRPA